MRSLFPHASFCPSGDAWAISRAGEAELPDAPACGLAVVSSAVVGATAIAAVCAAVYKEAERRRHTGYAQSMKKKSAEQTLIERVRAARHGTSVGTSSSLMALLCVAGCAANVATLCRIFSGLDDRVYGYMVVYDLTLAAAWFALLVLAVSEHIASVPVCVLLTVIMASSTWEIEELVRQSRSEVGEIGTPLFHWRLACGAVCLATAAVAFAVTLYTLLRHAPSTFSIRTDAELESSPLLGPNGGEKSNQNTKAKGPKRWYSLLGAIWGFAWPHEWRLKLRVMICLLTLIAGRVCNLYQPIMFKRMLDRFGEILIDREEGAPMLSLFEVMNPSVIVYLVLFFINGGGNSMMGILSNFRTFWWIVVQQDTSRRTLNAMFRHLFSMSLDFHLKRKSGEILRVMSRGQNAIQGMLSSVLFYAIPTMADIFIACIFFSTSFDPYLSILVFVTLGSYIPVTVVLTEWRVGFRRAMNKLDNQVNQRPADALLNYETVRYFSTEDYEQEQYDKTIRSYQTKEWLNLASLSLLNTCQALVILSGLIVGMVMCSNRVRHGDLTVGEAALFISYLLQLYSPLAMFGTYYRTLQQGVLDLEMLLDYLDIEPDVADPPGGEEYSYKGGNISVRDVHFAYDAIRKINAHNEDQHQPSALPVLKGVSFEVPSGTATALVGATGSGKSTALRLLFRSYDVTSGAVCIDSQDVRSVTQSSLHKYMAVVPQDTVLFNDTIRHNVSYGSIGASQEDIEAAARAASIHDHIANVFPDGYDTVVGERGLRLSGGEKQRVAMARAVLKAAPILLLDEATSALDSLTERKVQAAVRSLRDTTKCTTVCVAHRLSTIMDSDQILVFDKGMIVERGTHNQLMATNGLYAKMWSRQQAEAAEGDDS